MPEQHENWTHQSSFKFENQGMHNVRSSDAKTLKEELEALEQEAVIPTVLNVARQFAGLDPQANAVATVAQQMPVASVQVEPPSHGGKDEIAADAYGAKQQNTDDGPFPGMVSQQKYSTWFKDPSAPNCSCGTRALRMEWKSSKGNDCKAHKCFRSFPSGKGGCDFHEWVGK